jgi:hypothetical protein
MKTGKYGNLFLTEPELVNKPKIKMSTRNAYIDSKSHFGIDLNFAMGWRYIKEPMLFDRIPQTFKGTDNE